MYTAQNRYGLDDQSLWSPGDTHQKVAQRALAAHGGAMSDQHRTELGGIAGGGAYAPSGPAPAAPGAPATGPGMVTTSQQAVTAPATVGGQTPQGGQTNVAASFQQALVNKLNPAPVNAQNPAVAGSINANRLAEQRGLERSRGLAAERAHAGGYNDSGPFDSQLFGMEQARSAREGAFEGQQLQDLQKQQSQEMMAALALGGGHLIDQDKLGLSRYGIDTDAALRREGLGVQGSLGNRDLDLRGELGRGNLNLGLLSLLSGNDNFDKELAGRLGMHNSQMDNNFWTSILR